MLGLRPDQFLCNIHLVVLCDYIAMHGFLIEPKPYQIQYLGYPYTTSTTMFINLSSDQSSPIHLARAYTRAILEKDILFVFAIYKLPDLPHRECMRTEEYILLTTR